MQVDLSGHVDCRLDSAKCIIMLKIHRRTSLAIFKWPIDVFIDKINTYLIIRTIHKCSKEYNLECEPTFSGEWIVNETHEKTFRPPIRLHAMRTLQIYVLFRREIG